MYLNSNDSTHPLIDHALSEGSALFKDLPARLQRPKEINELFCCLVTVHRGMSADRGTWTWT